MNIIKRLMLRIGYTTYKNWPRSSTRYASEYFRNKMIDVIEVGVAGGLNARNMFDWLPIKKLFLIDNYKDTPEYPYSSSWEKEAEDLLEPYGKKVKWLKMDSNKACKQIKKRVDFIYIDGCHEHKQVIKDLENYWPLLKRGGIFAGHDIIFHRGVSKAIIEFCHKKKLNPIFNFDDWIIIKSGNGRDV